MRRPELLFEWTVNAIWFLLTTLEGWLIIAGVVGLAWMILLSHERRYDRQVEEERAVRRKTAPLRRAPIPSAQREQILAELSALVWNGVPVFPAESTVLAIESPATLIVSIRDDAYPTFSLPESVHPLIKDQGIAQIAIVRRVT